MGIEMAKRLIEQRSKDKERKRTDSKCLVLSETTEFIQSSKMEGYVPSETKNHSYKMNEDSLNHFSNNSKVIEQKKLEEKKSNDEIKEEKQNDESSFLREIPIGTGIGKTIFLLRDRGLLSLRDIEMAGRSNDKKSLDIALIKEKISFG